MPGEGRTLMGTQVCRGASATSGSACSPLPRPPPPPPPAGPALPGCVPAHAAAAHVDVCGVPVLPPHLRGSPACPRGSPARALRCAVSAAALERTGASSSATWPLLQRAGPAWKPRGRPPLHCFARSSLFPARREGCPHPLLSNLASVWRLRVPRRAPPLAPPPPPPRTADRSVPPPLYCTSLRPCLPPTPARTFFRLASFGCDAKTCCEPPRLSAAFFPARLALLAATQLSLVSPSFLPPTSPRPVQPRASCPPIHACTIDCPPGHARSSPATHTNATHTNATHTNATHARVGGHMLPPRDRATTSRCLFSVGAFPRLPRRTVAPPPWCTTEPLFFVVACHRLPAFPCAPPNQRPFYGTL